MIVCSPVKKGAGLSSKIFNRSHDQKKCEKQSRGWKKGYLTEIKKTIKKQTESVQRPVREEQVTLSKKRFFLLFYTILQ